MKYYYIYMLECADGLIYTGMTNDLTRRLNEHQEGKNKKCFTFKRRPITLIFYEQFMDVNQAIDFEKQIKKWSSEKKLVLAKGDDKALKQLAICRNETHHRYYNK